MGSFITSTGINPGTNRLEIATDHGTIIVENDRLRINELDVSLAEYTGINQPPIQMAKVNYELQEPKTAGHAMVLNAFAGAILRGTELVADGKDGLNELMISNAMYLSSWTDSTVKLPMNEDLFYEELKKRIAESKHKTVEARVIDATSLFN